MANYGIQDEKILYSAAVANTGGAVNVFTVSGLVLVKAVWSRITIASGACNVSWEFDPTAGTANQALCAAADMNAGLVGDYLTIVETAGARTMNVGATIAGKSFSEWILPAGTLTFVSAAADGTLVHYIWYKPIADGAAITLA